jgi:predicted Zn finger-like uncharacterized protein
MLKQKPMQEPLEFTCPHCKTAYRVVQIQADVHSDAKVDCLVCGRPLQASDERSFFKYFLVDPLQVSLRQLLATDRDDNVSARRHTAIGVPPERDSSKWN